MSAIHEPSIFPAMNRIYSLFIALTFALTPFAFADENHDIIEKVMKEGLKGDDSLMAKVLDKKATAEETKSLNDLVKTLEGTKPARGEQEAYDTKVKALIDALAKVAEGDTSDGALDALDEAQSCKACHSEHKPKKEKKN